MKYSTKGAAPRKEPRRFPFSLKFQSGKLNLFFNAILNMFLISFLIFSYPIKPHATIYWMYQTTCQTKPTKFLIKLYISHWSNTLPIKKLSLQELLLF